MIVHPPQKQRFRFSFGDAQLFSFYKSARNIEIAVDELVEAESLTSLAKSIAREREVILIFRGVRAGSTRPQIRRKDDTIVYTMATYQHHCVDLEQSFEHYKNKFSAKTRATLQRKLRKLEQTGAAGFEVRRYAHARDLDAFFEIASKISEQTYQERLLGIGLPHSATFIANAKKFADENSLRAFILFLNGEACAYLYCPAKNGVLTYAYVGHLPAMCKLSVGTVLQWCALESIFAEQQFKIFDFTEGENEHKRLFSSYSNARQNIALLPNTMRNLGFVYLHSGCNTLSRAIGRAMQKMGIKTMIKKLLRRQYPQHSATSAQH
jgi:CelD/BcsL family acetyltransferase involved in cellulose biosynthesis